MDLSNIDINPLIKLADKDLDKQVEIYGGGGSLEIREALAEEAADERKRRVKAAVTQIVAVKRAKDDFLTLRAKEVRSLEIQIEKLKGMMEGVSRATNYADETNNYLPLANMLGIYSPASGENSDLTKIPKDWTPAPAAPAPVVEAEHPTPATAA